MRISARIKLFVAVGVLLLFEVGITIDYLRSAQMIKAMMSSFWILITVFVVAKQDWLRRTENSPGTPLAA